LRPAHLGLLRVGIWIAGPVKGAGAGRAFCPVPPSTDVYSSTLGSTPLSGHPARHYLSGVLWRWLLRFRNADRLHGQSFAGTFTSIGRTQPVTVTWKGGNPGT